MSSAVLSNVVAHLRREGCLGTLAIYGHALRWKAHRDVLHSEFLVRRIFGYRMLLSLTQEGISEVLNLYGRREAEHVYILERVLREGMCVLDIGGNIGYYTLMMAMRVGAQGKVYAVEPVPANCSLLRRNVDLNHCGGWVEVFEMGISDRTAQRPMALSRQSNLHSFHPDTQAAGAAMLDLSGETVQVRTEDLGTFLDGKRRPELLRMDVEGHEVEILTSLSKEASARGWYPDVLFECHAHMYDPQTHDIVRPMRELFAMGYRVSYMASNREPATGFKDRGYLPVCLVDDHGRQRGIYENVAEGDALAIMQERGQARCLLLRRAAGANPA